jgi:hypothetical protein
MSVWSIIKNLSLIMSFVRSIESLVREVAQKKSVPEAKSIDTVLNHVETLLRKGVIDIPEVDEIQIADAIKAIREQLTTP